MYYAYNPAGKDLGPFTVEQLRAKLDSGEFPADKLIRAEATKDDWQSLSTVLGIAPSPSALPSSDAVSRSVVSRYRDAYLVARATTTIGAVVKAIGVALGFLIVAVSAIAGGQAGDAVRFLVGGILLGPVIGVPLFVLGVLVSAHGQVLKATLDTAVHSSPFLNKEDMARVMSI